MWQWQEYADSLNGTVPIPHSVFKAVELILESEATTGTAALSMMLAAAVTYGHNHRFAVDDRGPWAVGRGPWAVGMSMNTRIW